MRSAKVHDLHPSPETQWIYDRVLGIAETVNAAFWRFDLSGIFHPIKVIRYDVGDHCTWHTDVGAGVVSDRKLSITVQLSGPWSYAGGNLELVAGPSPEKAARAHGSVDHLSLIRPSPSHRGNARCSACTRDLGSGQSVSMKSAATLRRLRADIRSF